MASTSPSSAAAASRSSASPARGKSVTALTIMRLIDEPPGEIAGGEVWFDGRDLLTLPIEELRGRSAAARSR